jgi:hypothetical protein
MCSNISSLVFTEEEASLHCKTQWEFGKAWKYNQKLYLVFIDHEKAFDSEKRSRLWEVIQEYGVK